MGPLLDIPDGSFQPPAFAAAVVELGRSTIQRFNDLKI